MSNTDLTVVVNKRTATYDVYIGRPSIFGNPFKIGVDGSREEVIEKFKAYFYKRTKMDEEFRANILRLRGKVLGCYCKPLSCHGDVIAEYLNSLELTINNTNNTYRYRGKAC